LRPYWPRREFLACYFPRLPAHSTASAGSDLEIVGRAAERSHHQRLGIPEIRMAAGMLGTSNAMAISLSAFEC